MKKNLTLLLSGLLIATSAGMVATGKPNKKQAVEITNQLCVDIAKDDSIAINRFHETVVAYKGGQTVRVAHVGYISDRVFMDKEVARKYANIISYHRGLLHPQGLYFTEEGQDYKKRLIQEANRKWGKEIPNTVEYMLPVYLMNEDAIKAYEFPAEWIESYRAE